MASILLHYLIFIFLYIINHFYQSADTIVVISLLLVIKFFRKLEYDPFLSINQYFHSIFPSYRTTPLDSFISVQISLVHSLPLGVCPILYPIPCWNSHLVSILHAIISAGRPCYRNEFSLDDCTSAEHLCHWSELLLKP